MSRSMSCQRTLVITMPNCQLIKACVASWQLAKPSVTNAITNCYERRTNDFQTMDIREDNGKTGRFIRNYSSYEPL